MIRALSVKQFSEYIKSSLKHDPIFQKVAIKGEVSSYKLSYNHLFFSLKEGEDVIDCVIYYYLDKNINYNFDIGDKIEVNGNLVYNNYSSKLTINITKIEELGISEEYKIFLKLKKEFEKRGFFDQTRKKDIPKFPKKIGLITSKNSAAIEDFISVINKFPNDIKIYFYPVKVQGKSSVYEIINGINLLDEKNLDLIVITRGGGSKEDLSIFNDASIVEKVYSTTTPLISAIGHKIDQTLIDLVSDLSLQTPTEAGNIVVNDYKFLQNEINNIYIKIKKAMFDILDLKDLKLSFLKNNINKFKPSIILNSRIDELNKIGLRLNKQLKENLDYKISNFRMIELRLKTIKKILDLNKNKIKLIDMKGQEIFSKYSLQKDQYIKIVLSDGEVLVQIKDESNI